MRASIALYTVGNLRLADNPALEAACRRGAVVPLFVWAPDEDGRWAPGAASRWWLDGSLRALDADLRQRGSRLVVRRGTSTATVVDQVIAETGADYVSWQRGLSPTDRQRDALLQRTLDAARITHETFNAQLLVDAADIDPVGAAPARVFSRFWRLAQPLIDQSPPIPARARLSAPESWPDAEPIDALDLQPTAARAAGLRATWHPGERSATAAVTAFLEHLERYRDQRPSPAADATSRLSPHLHFGELSPRQVWSALDTGGARSPVAQASATEFRRQLGWRDYAHYVIFHFPEAIDRSLDPRFDRIAWRTSPTDLRAWQRGQSGYPLIDAGLRQLWRTGWMHNRVRMAVASFLVKDLLLPWQDGARWFWETLVDADLANNTLNWQWTAGSGPDAAPFPRVFNPTLQAERFDRHGDYIRRHVPELSRLPAPFILQPWTAPADVLAAAAVEIGRTYPEPIVDHAAARHRALDALRDTRRALREGPLG